MISELILVSTIILICILFNRFSDKYGIPLLMFFIVFGMAFGTDGLQIIEFENYNIAEDICSIGLIFIMFYGGFGTNWKFAKPVAVISGVLATVGVALTALFTGLFCYFVLGMQKLDSFLIGAVISSTDAASVFSILRAKKLALRYNTASLLEMESGSNDPMSYLLTILALSLMQGDYSAGLIKLFFTQILFGVFFGVLFAVLSVQILRKADLNKNGFDSMFVLALALLSYAVPSALDGNGYLSAYICGIILGNTPFKNKIQLVHFFDGLTGLSQILLFFMLGLLATPSALLSIWQPALAIALFLTLVGRPLAVALILGPMRCPVRQNVVVATAGIRGAASIVFAIMATVSPATTSVDVFHIVFAVCLLSIALQGTLLPVVSRKINMVDETSDVLKTFNDYEDANFNLLNIHLGKNHPWVGRMIRDLALAANTLIVMIKREGQTLIPNGNTLLEYNDNVIISGESYVDDEQIKLEEIKVDHSHKWRGCLVKDLELPQHTLVVVIHKGNGSTVIPKGDSLIEMGDTVVINRT